MNEKHLKHFYRRRMSINVCIFSLLCHFIDRAIQSSIKKKRRDKRDARPHEFLIFRFRLLPDVRFSFSFFILIIPCLYSGLLFLYETRSHLK